MSSNTLHAEASANVGGSAADAYRMIADYRVGHTRIIPPRHFRNLRVEEGGYGAGTVIRYDLRAFGKTNHARARVTEPEPGRVLVETDLDRGAVTTFIVDPVGPAKSRVTIMTDMPTRSGLLGFIERAVIRQFLRRVYVAELALLDVELRIDARGLRVLPGRRQPEGRGRKKNPDPAERIGVLHNRLERFRICARLDRLSQVRDATRGFHPRGPSYRPRCSRFPSLPPRWSSGRG